MRRVSVALAGILLLTFGLGAQVGTPTIIRIAFTTFDGPETAKRDGRLDPVVAFVQNAGEEIGKSTGRPVDFEFVLGNYYQVWSWFKEREIDAAFVSPLTAYLLEQEGTATPILELPEKDLDGRGSYCSQVTAVGTPSRSPEAEFQAHLSSLLTGEPASTTRLNFVAHLSSSGFVMPTLYALDWLDSQERVTPEARAAFWDRYFERARFVLQHGRNASDPARTEIYFSYSGSGTGRSCTVPPDGWSNLGAERNWPAPDIPYDVLVVRTTVMRDVLGSMDRNQIADRLVRVATLPGSLGPDTVYTDVRRYNVRTHGAFRENVDRLFGPNATDSTLRERGRRWFGLGRFDFTIDETLGFLRQDQRNSGMSRLALALSGGGVKSLYQAGLIDALYGKGTRPSPWLKNDRQSTTPPAPDKDDPLVVHSVIGTSGGAMLAFFTSLLPNIPGVTAVALPTASKSLFPWIDVPRIVSWIVVLLIFAMLLHLAKTLNPVPPSPGEDGPWRVPGGLLRLLIAPALLILVALATRQLRVPYIEHVSFVRGAEGTFYAISAALIHMALVCVERRSGADPQAVSVRGGQGRIGLLLGVSIIAVAIILRVIVSDKDTSDEVLAWLPLLAMTGIALAVASLIIAASGGWRGFRLAYAREYGRALSLVAFVIGLSFLTSVSAAWMEWSTTLELTSLFWIWTVTVSVLLSLGMLAVARRQTALGRYVASGVYHLTRDRVGGLTLSLAAGMTAFFSTAILVWVLMVAPAVYGSERAENALQDALPKATLESGAFRANLIVTGTMLSDEPCPAIGGRVSAGPIYSCFEGPDACVKPTDRWQVFGRAVPKRALPAVFASGAPFPVFPPKKVSMPNGCEVPLVDGGYAHNVPLEAAVASEARQVLVINASPQPTSSVSRWRNVASGLLQGAPRILGFMFTQAQALDQNVGRELMVAALGPRYRPDWPFLLDFRAEQQDLVTSQARRDIDDNRRIGSIESWGTPLVYAVIRPTRSQNDTGLGTRWTPLVREALQKLLDAKPAGTAAAFDLDNTILRGDIGDALFLKIVAELHYDGDNPQFWDRIPDAATRTRLRQYWARYSPQWRPTGPATPRIRYDAPRTWPDGFADYVGLFMQQYRRLLDPPDGARQAYPWVVQLMAGIHESTVRELAASLWASEMERPASAASVKSQFGDFTIEGGIRVHGEIDGLLLQLRARRWDVWMVTASNQYVAEEAARHLGIGSSHVLGIRQKTENGVLTGELLQPVTYREGKQQALEQAGVRPDLAVGDSMTDFEMLAWSTTAIVIDRGRIPRNDSSKDWYWQPQSTLTATTVR
jgi:phosphoserine phosphatase/predicted acylesterase/phospholipase RssA